MSYPWIVDMRDGRTIRESAVCYNSAGNYTRPHVSNMGMQAKPLALGGFPGMSPQPDHFGESIVVETNVPCDWCVLRATDAQIATIIQDEKWSLQEKIDVIRHSMASEKFALDGGYDERIYHVTWEYELGENT